MITHSLTSEELNAVENSFEVEALNAESKDNWAAAHALRRAIAILQERRRNHYWNRLKAKERRILRRLDSTPVWKGRRAIMFDDKEYDCSVTNLKEAFTRVVPVTTASNS